MSRARWGGLAVVMILIVALLAMGIRQVVVRSSRTAGAGDEAWKTYLLLVDRAVDARDVDLANRAWREAYGAALGSRRWEPMLAVGQAARRAGDAAGLGGGFEERARQAYVTALARARQQRSIDGVLRVAEASVELDDVELVTSAIRVAERLAPPTSGDAQVPARVAALRARLRDRSPEGAAAARSLLPRSPPAVSPNEPMMP